MIKAPRLRDCPHIGNSIDHLTDEGWSTTRCHIDQCQPSVCWIPNFCSQSMESWVWNDYELFGCEILLDPKEGTSVTVIYVHFRFRDAKEGVRGSHSLQGDVVMFKYVSWVNIFFVFKAVMMQLVVHDNSVWTSPHDGGNLCGELIIFGFFTLFSCTLSYGITNEIVQEEVTDAYYTFEKRECPIEQSHIIVIEKSHNRSRVLQTADEISHDFKKISEIPTNVRATLDKLISFYFSLNRRSLFAQFAISGRVSYVRGLPLSMYAKFWTFLTPSLPIPLSRNLSVLLYSTSCHFLPPRGAYVLYGSPSFSSDLEGDKKRNGNQIITVAINALYLPHLRSGTWLSFYSSHYRLAFREQLCKRSCYRWVQFYPRIWLIKMRVYTCDIDTPTTDHALFLNDQETVSVDRWG